MNKIKLNTPTTPSKHEVGDIFRVNGQIVMLSRINFNTLIFICLVDGNRWSDAFNENVLHEQILDMSFIGRNMEITISPKN